MREALKVDYQEFWRLVDLYLLCGHYEFLALATVPLVVARKGFLLHEMVQAVVQVDIRATGRALGFTSWSHLLRQWLLDHFDLRWRVALPLDDENKIFIRALLDEILQLCTLSRVLEVTVVFVHFVAEVAFVP